MVIALEGLPGAGKTTSAVMLGRRLRVETVCETTQDHPFLHTVYDHVSRHDLQVELAFLLLHSAAYRELSARRAAVSDFSPVKDLFFAEDMLSGSDLDLFKRVYRHLYDGKSLPQKVIFLDASPELCMERVRRRLSRDENRVFEEGLELERLQRMYDIYWRRVKDLGERVLCLPISDDLTEGDVVDRLLEVLDIDLPIQL
jgi:deoxyguanosine kinase